MLVTETGNAESFGLCQRSCSQSRGKGERIQEIPVVEQRMRCGAGLESCCCLSCKEEKSVQGQLLGLEVLLLLLG